MCFRAREAVRVRTALIGIALLSLAMIAGSGCPGVSGSPGTGNNNTGSSGSSAETGTGTGPGAGSTTPTGDSTIFKGAAVVLGYNELGMHCMNQNFSELMILPPFNSLRAQVIARGGEPRILTSNITVAYGIPGNTHSSDKTNFWTYAPQLLGVSLADNIGLAGNGLSGTMKLTGENDWVATGIPLTPITDAGQLDPFQLGTITVTQNGQTLAATQAVVPVSWEIRCDLCHHTPGITTETDILRAHDRNLGTNLEQSKPVMCASCHADAALSAPGKPKVSTLSSAIHLAHAPRMATLTQLTNECYACHPGQATQCLRDVHFARGMSCKDCHTSMQVVGDPNRRPWVDEPRCGGCHNRAGSQYEQANTLYRMSKGHSNVHCPACHGAPHAITPTVDTADNVQAIALQGHAGKIDTCTVCHTSQPGEAFFHSVGEAESGD